MKSKTVKIDSTAVTVREFTVAEISELFAMDDAASLVDRMVFMLDTCSSMNLDEIREYSPSDLQPLIDALLEVNQSFFAQAEAVGMEAATEAVKSLLKSLSMIVFVPASQQDTDKESGNIPGRSS